MSQCLQSVRKNTPVSNAS